MLYVPPLFCSQGAGVGVDKIMHSSCYVGHTHALAVGDCNVGTGVEERHNQRERVCMGEPGSHCGGDGHVQWPTGWQAAVVKVIDMASSQWGRLCARENMAAPCSLQRWAETNCVLFNRFEKNIQIQFSLILKRANG